MKKITRKLAIFLVFVFVISSVAEVGGGMTAKAAGNEGYTVTFEKMSGEQIKVVVVTDEKFLSSIPSLQNNTSSKVYYWQDTSNEKKYQASQLKDLEIKRNYAFKEVGVDIKSYEVKFTYPGLNVGPFQIIEGQKVTAEQFAFGQPNGGPAGATFVAWGKGINSPNRDPWISNKINNDTVITENWDCIPLFVYSITFKRADDSETTYQVEAGKELICTVDHGEYFDEQTSSGDSTAAVGNQCTFDGWYAAGGSRVSATDEINKTFDKHTELQAKWTKTTGNFKVTFKVAGLSGAEEDIVIDRVAKDAVILNFPTVTKKGYSLVRWNTKEDGTGEDFQPQITGQAGTKVKGDLTLYPVFEKNRYEVQFNYRSEDTSISETDRENTELSLIYKEKSKILTDTATSKKAIAYDEKIPNQEKPTDVAETIVQKYIAPDAKNPDKNIEYTVTCEFTGDWKVAKTQKKWNFTEDTVTDHMKKTAAADKSLHPVYKKTYEPYDPPEGYAYDEDDIFDLPSRKVTFRYTNTGGKAASKVKKVPYGRRIPSSAIPADVQKSYKLEFRDRASLDSDEYISYTATYTYSEKWARQYTMNFWNFNSDLVTQDETLVPVYSVKFDPYTPPYDGSCEGGGTDDKDSVDQLKDRYVEITFDHNNGSGLTTILSVPKGRAMDPNVAPDVKKDGKKFLGWSKQKEGTTLYNWSEIVTEKLTLYAIWQEQADIIYNSEGGSYISVETVVIGEKAPKPEDPTKENYTFLGWSKTRQQGHTSSEYEKYAYDFTKPVTEADLQLGMMNLYAWYKGDTKVLFYYNRSSDDNEFREEEVIGADKNTPVFPRYTPDEKHSPDNKYFNGWYSSREGGNEVTSKNFRLEEGKTLKVYAHWSDGYRVTYVIENGNRQTIFYKNGEIAHALDVEQKNGKMITDWYLEPGYVEKVNWGGIHSDTTVYAKWESIPEGTVTITFDANGGAFSDHNEKREQPAAKGKKIGESIWPEAPTHKTDENLIFGGWALKANGEDTVNAETYLPSKNVTFYAKWVYEVKFDLRGKATVEGIPNQYVCKDKYIEEPKNIKSKQYLLYGWTKDPNQTSESARWDFAKDTVTGPMTLYAVWGAPVTYDCNGGYFEGDVSLEATVDANNHVIKIDKEPVYPGKEFAGWYQDEFGIKPFYFAGDTTHQPTEIKGLTKIYAKWDDLGNMYQISVNGGKASHYSAVPGKRVAVIARIPEGKLFVRWESEDVVFEKPENRTTTFIMPDKSVEVTAIYKDDPDYKAPNKDKNEGSKPNNGNQSGGGSSSGDSGNGGGNSGDKNQNGNTNGNNGNGNGNKTSAEDKIVTMDAPVKGGKAGVTVPDEKVSTAIEAALLDEALDEADHKDDPQASVVLDINTKKKADKVTVKLTGKALQELAASDVDVLEIKGTETTLKLDGSALQEITDVLGLKDLTASKLETSSQQDGTISFIVGKNTQKLSKSAKKVMGKRPTVNVKIQYQKKVNGKTTTKKITSLSKGKVEVRIPYKATKSEKKKGVEHLKAVYVDTKGKAYYVNNSKYDSKNKVLIFKVNKVNTYGIAFKK